MTLAFVEDMLKHIENDEEEDYETNQQHVGMQKLFCGYVVIDWEGTNLNITKHKKLNKTIVRKCVEFYVKCWKERNEEHHNDDKQRNRLMKWYEKIKLKAENSNQRQMLLCIIKNDVKFKQCRTETIKDGHAM